MASVTFEHVYKQYPNGFEAVKDFNMEINDKEFIIFVGPSGCGKSTTMRMVAGLEDVTSGKVKIGGKTVNDLPPKDRNIAMVFQDYALYPHMTVKQNMSLGLRLKKTPANIIEQKIEKAADVLDLKEVLDRYPRQLSGGQRQRVAVGRAIVRTPDVFMFDEPLSNLDPKLRTTMRVEIKKLHKQLDATMIYVTHDQIEAMTLGDRIVVLNKGEIQQIDDPITLYNKPANRFVARFIGSPPINIFDCELVDNENGFFVKNDFMEIPLSEKNGLHKSLKKGFKSAPLVTVGVRSEDLNIGAKSLDKKDDSSFNAVVDVIEPVGSEVYVHVKAALNSSSENDTDKTIVVRAANLIGFGLQSGDNVSVTINPEKIYLFDTETEKTLL